MRFDVELVPEDTKPYFRHIYDHAMRVNEMADTLREVLSTALNANLSVISVRRTRTPNAWRPGPRSSLPLRRLPASMA
jgi:Mg2+ and Co2+ transporter CorA